MELKTNKPSEIINVNVARAREISCKVTKVEYCYKEFKYLRNTSRFEETFIVYK